MMLPDHDAVLELTIEVLHKVNYSFFSLLYCSSYFHFEYSIVGMGLEVLRYMLVWCTWLKFGKDL